MKLRNRRICLFLLVCILIATSVCAVEVADSKPLSAVYIESAICPSEYIEYAESNVDRFLKGTDFSSELPNGRFELGNPFSFTNEGSDVFYFPVLCDGEIEFLFRVFPLDDGGYSGILSSMLVDEISKLGIKSSMKKPMGLSMVGNEIVASIGEEEYTLFEYLENAVSINGSVARSESTEKTTVEITKPRLIIGSIQEITSRSSDSRYLGTNNTITETQQNDEPWCTAYSEAWIMRCIKTDFTSAVHIMSYIHGRVSTEDTLSHSEAITYAHYRGVYPIDHDSKLSNDLLIAELVNNRPVLYSVTRATQGSHAYHAIVLRGYNGDAETWSVWNPWYNVYETIDMGDVYVPYLHQSYTYRYYDTMTNFD